tara:strand:- start:154 stop:513 length:360 start_codon:yes stop_codon:yes gene_type:complete
MAKVLKKVSNPKLPPNVKVFQDHLALGLECFELDWFDFSPMTCTHRQHGDGLAFSQYGNWHEDACKENYSLIVSNEGLHMPNQKLMPFTNEQPPTKMALLVLSAMVMQNPLNYTCPNCD